MTVEITRTTLETDIRLTLAEGEVAKAQNRIFSDPSLGFFEHMLSALLYYAHLDVTLTCTGDVWVDTHHTLEDVGIVLGLGVKKLLEQKDGYARYGTAFVPMDEALVRTVLDLSGRPYFIIAGFDLGALPESEQALVEFLRAWSQNAGVTLHIDVIRGTNRHHIFEAVFKSVGLALAQALSTKTAIVSTKGRLL
jgi:imidazoleglycerol-phosphate dehydratase